jgi:hypothetical protein
MPETEEVQDLHISKASMPDPSWARMQPIQIAPSKERLDAKHQNVSIKNVSDVQVLPGGRPPKPQTHVVIDRFMVGHELLPGQTKPSIDMLVTDIEYFVRERSHRLNNFGQPKPLHPIVIVGFNPLEAARDPEVRLEQGKDRAPAERPAERAADQASSKTDQPKRSA